MGNGLKNAGGLDGVLNWNVAGGGVLSVDESVNGAPGRAVFSLIGPGVLAATYAIFSDPIPAAADQVMEGYADWYSTTAPAGAYLQPLDAGGQPIGAEIQLSSARIAQTAPRRGLFFTFNRSYGRVAMPPATVSVRFGVGTTLAANGVFALFAMKPYLAPAPSFGRPTVWDPGTHTNPDLQLPVWPSDLPPFQADSLPEPITNMTGYGSDTNIQATRDLYSGLQFSFKGHMRLDYDQVDVLEQFYDANRNGFFVQRPDTNQLCVARWLPDGAPKPTTNMGVWTIYEVGLRLAVC